MRLGAEKPGTNKPLLSIVASLLTAIVLTSLPACAGDSSQEGTPDGASSSASRAATVTIKGFAFEPERLRVTAGAAVAVVNADDTEHTLTADDGSFDTGTVKGGGSASVTPAKAGTAGYFCEIHDYMKGTFDVG